MLVLESHAQKWRKCLVNGSSTSKKSFEISDPGGRKQDVLESRDNVTEGTIRVGKQP